MKNMGLSSLYLVSPMEFPSFEASRRASSATDVLTSAVVVDSLAEALQGCSFAVGASARLRNVKWPQLDSRECGQKLFEESEVHEVALVFGRERTGLHNEELEHCQSLVHIPTNDEYSSLNVASAVQVLSYEIFMAARGEPVDAEQPIKYAQDKLATADQMESMYGHFFDTMKQLNFFGQRNPEYVLRKLRCLFGRARPSSREVQILRGMLSAAQGKKDRQK
jgi:TrmH family RNA methyltransferase